MPDPALVGSVELRAWVELFIYVLGALVLLLWLFMPFAIFGTKRLLREQSRILQELVAEQRRSNEILYRLSIEEPLSEVREPAFGARGEAPALPAASRVDPDPGRREPALEPGRTRVSLVADRNERLL